MGLDHLLAMVSVGVISHQMGGRAILAVPTTFVGVMAFGGILGMINIGLFPVELGIALLHLVGVYLGRSSEKTQFRQTYLR